ncbi:MAG: hypothetical protein ACI4JD_01910 [Ruminococcus sp.]
MEITPEMLTQLNTFTRRELTADEVYIFRVRLCDNEIDRDGERFSLDSLEKMKELFLGRTGIFDHDPSGEKQTARIFQTELVTEKDKTTKAGESYTSLCAYAYMVKTSGNEDLIREIDGGIKKEVSVSVSAASKKCSICGRDKRISPCCHMTGEEYDGKVCHTVLSDITDAYEWSFVAVPAQRNAGVTKHYGNSDSKTAEINTELIRCKRLLSDIEDKTRREVMKLRFFRSGKTEKAFSRIVSKMELSELLELKEELLQMEERNFSSQLSPMQKTERKDDLSPFCTR